MATLSRFTQQNIVIRKNAISIERVNIVTANCFLYCSVLNAFSIPRASN